MNWLQKEFKRAEERRATLPPHARPVLTRGSFASVLEEGDTGEALLPCRPKWAALLDADESVDQAKVNAKGVHADRDGSEAPFVYCGRGVCAANEGHEGTCAEASGWADEEAPRPETPSTEVARDRDAESSIPNRLEILRDMTDGDRRAMLAWISGFAPDVFDRAVNR